VLLYRGYPIAELAEHATFLEVSYLLIYGELPTSDECAAFADRIRDHTMLHESLKEFFDGLPARRAPRWRCCRPRSARCRPSTRTAWTLRHPEHVEMSTCGCWPSCRRSRRTPTRSRSGQPFLYPDNSLGLRRELPAHDVRRAGRAVRRRPGRRALDMLFTLHADHEQNCSTSTVRLVGSSHANLFASVSAGVNALFGPAARRRQPGGAEMLQKIQRRRRRRRRFVRG
jgi:citrate synthase